MTLTLALRVHESQITQRKGGFASKRAILWEKSSAADKQ